MHLLNFFNTYTSFHSVISNIICFHKDVTRSRALRLVTKAYSSITVEKMSAFLGLSAEDCIEGKLHINLLTVLKYKIHL